MDNFSSGESSQPCSPQKAALFEDLKNARQSNAQYLDMIRQKDIEHSRQLIFHEKGIPFYNVRGVGSSYCN